MAHRTGLLQGPYLSSVQQAATEFLWVDERYREAEKEVRELKLAWLSTGKSDPKKLFPEVFNQQESEQEEVVSEKSEMDDMEQWLRSRGGTMTAADLPDDEGWI